jgi:hypothetical protein
MHEVSDALLQGARLLAAVLHFEPLHFAVFDAAADLDDFVANAADGANERRVGSVSVVRARSVEGKATMRLSSELERK